MNEEVHVVAGRDAVETFLAPYPPEVQAAALSGRDG